ncbi:MAG: M20/M25/M40 family metallo-hydrolase, partial [Bacillota bacterium]|nr:M20/M25/M40 family metallo-hydrolase [Bacillota bacterium]
MRQAMACLMAEDPGLSAQVSIARGEYKTYTGRIISGEKVLSSWKTPAGGLVAATAREALKAAGIEPREKAYSFCTNGSGSARLGVTTIGFGAGFEEQAHTRDEYIEVDQIERAAAGFASLAQCLTRSGRQMRLF